MFVDARTVADDTVLETDLCIVGAGAAGITLAREFAGRSLRVTVLEGGGFEFDAETQDLSAGENVGLPYFPLGAARLRRFGGTTNHWGGTCRPFHDSDFETRSWVPFSGWPISGADLRPYYRAAERVCGLRSGEWSADQWLERDRFKPLSFRGDRLETRIAQVVQSARRRFGPNFRRELEQAANVTTYLNANVTALETDEGGRVALRARVACLSGTRFVVQARRFVLAAHAIENARLLLVSTDSHPEGIGNQHDQVGRYFMEHPRLVTGIITLAARRTPMRLYQSHYAGGTWIKGYVAFSDETLRREEMVDVQIDLDPVYEPAFTRALGSGAAASFRTLQGAWRAGTPMDGLGTHVAAVIADVASAGKHLVPAAPLPLPTPGLIGRALAADEDERLALVGDVFGDLALTGYAVRHGRLPIDHVEVTTRVEQTPNPDSRVTLMRERDRLGVRKVQLDWRLTELDRHSMLRALHLLGAELGRAGLGRLRITLPEDDDGWPETLHGGWHHIGTTRMSDDPRTGVVDRNCRVHAMANLYVAGSSVFPTAGSGTPTLALVGLALRLADHLKESAT